MEVEEAHVNRSTKSVRTFKAVRPGYIDLDNNGANNQFWRYFYQRG